MSWVLLVDHEVNKRLKKISREDALRILAVIDSLNEDPFVGDTKKMKGEKDVWRRRVGNYRIYFEIRNCKIVHVYEVKRRTSSTY